MRRMILLCLVAPAPSFAADDSIVVTALAAPQPQAEAGRALTVVTRADIDRAQQASLADLLAVTPGITTTRTGGIGQPTALRLRGAEDAQTLVLIDGVRVNDPASPGAAFDFGTLLTGLVDRVEVLRGPASVTWGSQALGGVVNVSTDLVATGVEGEYGTHDRARVIGHGSIGGDALRLSAAGGWFRDGGVSAFRGGNEPDGFEQWAGRLRVSALLSPSLSVAAGGYYADSFVQYDGFPPPFYSFADTPQSSRTKQAVGYASVTLVTGPLRHKLTASLSDTARDAFDGATRDFAIRGRTQRFAYQGDAALSPALRVVFGAEHEWSRLKDAARQSSAIQSGYLQLVAKPWAALTLTAGARIDDHRSFGRHATFAGSAALALAPATTLRASFAQGFKAPTLVQLFSAYGNPALAPESADAFDVGLDHRGQRWGASLTLFRRTTANQIDFRSCYGGGPALCATRPFGFYDNLRRTRAEGLELALDAQPTPSLTARASYTLTDARNLDRGERLLRRPLHSGAVSLDWAGPVALGATLRFVSDSRDIDFVTYAPTSLDGYALADLRASVPVGPVTLFGRIENLFDARYEQVSGYGTYGRTLYVGARLTL